MGELLDKLNAAEANPGATTQSAIDQAAELFRAASERVTAAIETVKEPGMPLDSISRWTRQAPLQALAVAFLIGVMTVRRRRH
jgi:hypothetical protein